jgi:flavin reductase (DIM6/NTAB) family NADH-FMN oxidoreductase RutF
MGEIDLSTAIELCSPYPYTLVVTVDKQGKPNVMGVAWWTFTSVQPPMIAVSVGHPRYTHECLQNCKEFVVCFPSEEQAKAAWFCGTKSGRAMDKFAAAGLKAAPAKVVKPPIIEGVTVAYECKVVAEMECGDHTLFSGEVVAIHGDPKKAQHLYSVHYRKLVSIDWQGAVDFDLEYK